MEQLLVDAFNICYNSYLKHEDEKIGFCMHGATGLALCAHELAIELDDKDFLNKEVVIRERQFNSLVKDPSIGYGLSSMQFYLNSLSERDSFYEDIYEIEEVNKAFFNSALKSQCFDYYSGASGILLTFLVSNNRSEIGSMIDSYVKSLNNMFASNSIYTDSYGEDGVVKGVNLGTAHGFTGILLVLLKAYELGYKDNTRATINSLLHFIRSFEANFKSFICHYPQFVTKDDNKAYPSLTAFCYGDLMITYAFLKAGKLLGIDEYTEYGSGLAREFLMRTDVYGQQLCLCHGLSSIMVLLKYFYHYTGDKQYDNRKDMYYNDIILLFKSYLSDYTKSSEVKGFITNPSLFMGITGAIIAQLTVNNKSNYWEQILLV